MQNIHTSIGNITINIDTSRFDQQIKDAQKRLNMLVVSDSTPYISHQQGQLREQVRYPDGIYGGSVEWYAPHAHYLYQGELYLTEDGRSWANKDEVKYPTGKPLTYHTPGAGPRWFEVAKKNHGSEWIRQVKEIGGGGNA